MIYIYIYIVKGQRTNDNNDSNNNDDDNNDNEQLIIILVIITHIMIMYNKHNIGNYYY